MSIQEIDIHQLMRRLSGCPSSIYGFSGLEARGPVPVAIAQDTVFHLGGSALDGKTRESLLQMQAHRPEEAAFMMLGCFLISDSVFYQRSDLLDGCISLLLKGFSDLAAVSRAADFVSNTDRREEFVRLCLNHLQLRPSGESKEMFKNRWESLDTVHRVALMQKAAELRKRQEELRKAMERKAAEEAASKWSRE
ncbi:MAG: hypothetical protein RH862_03210 [Leptospiraceae bacterium]